jgi:hypothetical protein
MRVKLDSDKTFNDSELLDTSETCQRSSTRAIQLNANTGINRCMIRYNLISSVSKNLALGMLGSRMVLTNIWVLILEARLTEKGNRQRNSFAGPEY